MEPMGLNQGEERELVRLRVSSPPADVAPGQGELRLWRYVAKLTLDDAQAGLDPHAADQGHQAKILSRTGRRVVRPELLSRARKNLAKWEAWVQGPACALVADLAMHNREAFAAAVLAAARAACGHKESDS